MISRERAQAIAASHISSFSKDEDSCAIVEAQTIEHPHGWMFFYQARRYLETQHTSDALAGNAPLIVDRHTGQITETGTAHPPEYYLTQYATARHTDAD
jgi:hypothetical protein